MTQTATATCTASIEDGRIWLATPFKLKNLVKALPGARWSPKQKKWHVPATPSAARGVVDALDSHGLSAEQEILDMAKQLGHVGRIKDAIEGDGNLLPPGKTKTQPWHHQVQGYHLIASQQAAMLAWEMGTGKSKAVVDAICNLDDCRHVLIVCPKSVIDAWRVQFDRHAAADCRVVLLREGTVANRTRRANVSLAQADALNEKCILVINYEAVWRGVFGEWVLDRNWDMVVADEIHRIKSPGGRASRYMRKLGKKAKRRVGLTGTPMPHSPLDVYGQYGFLDDGILGTSFVRFRSRYAVMGGFQNHQVLGFQNQEELHAKFYSIAHRVKKSDVLDLPPTIHEERSVELSADAARIYHEVEDEFIADIGRGVITASNALARLLRLQQITSGYGVTDTGEQVAIDSAKATAFAEILDDLDAAEPGVVFCRFRHDLATVKARAEAAGRRCMELSGNVNELGEWQEAKGGEVLAVQIQAGGVGIDLTRAAYCVYYSLGFSLGDYVQSLARTDRPGQTRSVTYLHLIAKGTVDQKVYAALEARANVVESILSMADIKKEEPQEHSPQIGEVCKGIPMGPVPKNMIPPLMDAISETEGISGLSLTPVGFKVSGDLQDRKEFYADVKGPRHVGTITGIITLTGLLIEDYAIRRLQKGQ